MSEGIVEGAEESDGAWLTLGRNDGAALIEGSKEILGSPDGIEEGEDDPFPLPLLFPVWANASFAERARRKNAIAMS